MQSLAICARLVARAVSGTEAENFLYNSLLRLSTSSSVHHPQSSSNRPAISSSPAITRAVHLVTATSGYSGHDDDDEDDKGHLRKKKNSTKIQRTNRTNVYGDDAFFIAKNRLGDFLGVADGVGGWREHGIDPSLFSSSLMEACRSLIDNKLIDLNPLTLKELLSRGYKQLIEDKQCIIGSSTACIVALHKEKSILHTANLGDSGFVVIRKNTIVHRSQEQQHYFNSPFQLAIHPTIKDPRLIADSPDLASVTSFNVEENDFIVIATDGLWDNLPDATILAEIKKITEPTLDNLQRIAQNLAKRALENGHNPNFYSPFARSAKRSLGINICGGKPDDVTVLLAVVKSTCL
jgi:protein phosphatase PTC7